MSLLWKNANADPYESCDCPGNWLDGVEGGEAIGRANLILHDKLKDAGLPIQSNPDYAAGKTNKFETPCPDCGKRQGDHALQIPLEHGVNVNPITSPDGTVRAYTAHTAHWHEPMAYFPHKDDPRKAEYTPGTHENGDCRKNTHFLYPQEDSTESWNPRHHDEDSFTSLGHIDDPDITDKVKEFGVRSSSLPTVREHLRNCEYHQKMVAERKPTAPPKPTPRQDYKDFDY